MVGPGAAGGRAVPAARAWAPRWRRCTSSSSAASGGGIIAGFFTDAIGVRGTVIALGVPTSIIGGLLLMNGSRASSATTSRSSSRSCSRSRRSTSKRTRRRRRAARSCRSRTSTSPTARCRCCSTSTSRCTRGEMRRAAGHERRRQVDDPARDQRPRRAGTRRRATQRPERHLRRCPKHAGRPRHRAAAGRQGRVPATSRSVRTSRSSARLADEGRRARSTSHVDGMLELFPELVGRCASSWPAASPVASSRCWRSARVLDPQARDAAHRRAVARPRAGRRAAAAGAGRAAAGRSGQTMLIVEQSLNVALSIADRAIFLEKGEVRFEGAGGTSCSNATTSPARSSSGPRADDARRRSSPSNLLVHRSRSTGLIVALRRDGHRARLPLEPGHQLRRRRSRRPVGRAARGHGRQAATGPYWPALIGALARGHVVGHGHRAGGDPPAVPARRA